jgi:hypothetical protein
VHFGVGGGREAKESVCEDEFYKSVAARVGIGYVVRLALKWLRDGGYGDCFEREVQRISWGQGF